MRFALLVLAMMAFDASALAAPPAAACYRVVNVDVWDVLYIRRAKDHRSAAVGAIAPDHTGIVRAAGRCDPPSGNRKRMWCPVDYYPLPNVRISGFVKAYFIDPAPGGVPFVADSSSMEALAADFGIRLHPEARELKTVTLHGHYSENRSLMEAQPNYPAVIAAAARNPEQAKAWLSDDWDIVSGGMFDDVWDRKRHVLPTFQVPRRWQIYRAHDWGQLLSHLGVAAGGKVALPVDGRIAVTQRRQFMREVQGAQPDLIGACQDWVCQQVVCAARRLNDEQDGQTALDLEVPEVLDQSPADQHAVAMHLQDAAIGEPPLRGGTQQDRVR